MIFEPRLEVLAQLEHGEADGDGANEHNRRARRIPAPVEEPALSDWLESLVEPRTLIGPIAMRKPNGVAACLEGDEELVCGIECVIELIHRDEDVDKQPLRRPEVPHGRAEAVAIRGLVFDRLEVLAAIDDQVVAAHRQGVLWSRPFTPPARGSLGRRRRESSRWRIALSRPLELVARLGLLAAAVVIPLGFAATADMDHSAPGHDLVHVHRNFMLTTTGIALMTTGLGWWQRSPGGGWRVGLSVLSVVLVAVMSLGADRGGMLVFLHGVGVVEQPSGGGHGHGSGGGHGSSDGSPAQPASSGSQSSPPAPTDGGHDHSGHEQ